MKSIDRYAEFKDYSLDQILLLIQKGSIIAGRMARKVNYQNKKSIKELIENGNRKLKQ